MSRIYKRIKNLFRYIFLISDYETFELFGSTLMFLSSFVILNPYTDIYSNGTVYNLIRQGVNEELLGSIFLFVALNSLFALGHGSLKYRKYASVAQATLWAAIFVLFLTVNQNVWFPWFTGVLCLFSIATAARIHKDIREKIPPWTTRQ